MTVEGGVGQLETETATLSNVKPARDFIELPLSQFGRGDINVLYVTAGVNMLGCCDVVINGARGGGINFTADGAAVNNQAYSGRTANGTSMTVEAFKEAKIITSNAPAEYGQVSQVAIVSKSGENTLHGSVYWGNTNSITYARSFYDSEKPSFVNYNMFNINNGGPVYIPGLYDGRDKTFYFFDYGGARYRVGNRIRTSVPTPAFRQGDFSALLGQNQQSLIPSREFHSLIIKSLPTASVQLPEISRTWSIQIPTRRESAISVSRTISTPIPARSTTLTTTRSAWITKSLTATPCLPVLP